MAHRGQTIKRILTAAVDDKLVIAAFVSRIFDRVSSRVVEIKIKKEKGKETKNMTNRNISG